MFRPSSRPADPAQTIGESCVYSLRWCGNLIPHPPLALGKRRMRRSLVSHGFQLVVTVEYSDIRSMGGRGRGYQNADADLSGEDFKIATLPVHAAEFICPS